MTAATKTGAKHTPGPSDRDYIDRLLGIGPQVPPRLLRLIAAAPELRKRIEERVIVCCGLTGGTTCTFCTEDRALLARIDGNKEQR